MHIYPLALLAYTIKMTMAQNMSLTGISLPANYTYNLPEPFTGNLSTNFIDVNTSSLSVNNLFTEARNSTYISLDAEFDDILGSSPTIELVPNSTSTSNYAYEAGVWLYDHQQVWFTEDISTERPVGFFILNLVDLTISRPNISISNGANLNGGYYYDGLVYFTASGDQSIGLSPAVYSVDPTTFATEIVVNSYFGLPMNSIDDLTWVAPNTSAGSTSCTHAGEANMFFTSVDFDQYGIHGLETAVLPNAVYRFTPSTQSLQAVISRADILMPNGIRSSLDSRYLFVTDTAGSTTGFGPAANASGTVGIYRFTLDADCNPSNKIFFGLTRSGISDGIHVDDYGRVWTGEYDGIVVRNSRGKEIGIFNAEVLVNNPDVKIANFALAGDKLVVLAVDRIFVVQLGQTVVSGNRYFMG